MPDRNTTIKEQITKTPVLAGLARRIYSKVMSGQANSQRFPGSQAYWESRYAHGGTSGAGSFGVLAEFKAEIVNAFVAQHGITTVIEFGCGDGNQLELAKYPDYLGLDVSETAVSACRDRFASDPTKRFKELRQYEGDVADLALSLDVIYHLVEDMVFEAHMDLLFTAARRYVIIYANDTDISAGYGAHIRCRKFTDWIRMKKPDWMLAEYIPNRYPYKGDHRPGSFADFYIYARAAT